MSTDNDLRSAKRSVGPTALALGIVWSLGIVLMVGRTEWFGKLRSASIDAAAPVMTLVHHADRRWIDPVQRRWNDEFLQRTSLQQTANVDLMETGDSVEAAELSAAIEQSRLLQQRCDALQIQLARAAEERQRVETRLLSTSDVELAAYLIDPPDSLLTQELIPANWIGQIGAADGRLHPLLAVGTRDGIAVDELVLDADALHLDRGAEAGVTHDATVLDGRRLVGRIVEVGHWTSTVQPITDTEFRLSVQLLRNSGEQSLLGAKGVLTGHGDATCRMTYVDATLPVVVGDLVVTAPDDPQFPAMLVCGRVTRAELQDGSLEWDIVVEPATSFDELASVAILHQTLGTNSRAGP